MGKIPTHDEAVAMAIRLEVDPDLHEADGRVVRALPGEAIDIMLRHVVAKIAAAVDDSMWRAAMDKLCLMSLHLGDAQRDLFTIGLSLVSYVRNGGQVIFRDQKESKDETPAKVPGQSGDRRPQ